MLKEDIKKDLNEALKSREELKTSVLRLLSSAILNKEKDKRYKSGKAEDVSLTDEEIIDIISSESKKRKEAIELYQKGDRPELAKKEKEEMDILQKYLPEQLSEEEIKKLVEEAVAKTGAVSVKEMGKVMAVLTPQIKGKADMTLVSKLVKEFLML